MLQQLKSFFKKKMDLSPSAPAEVQERGLPIAACAILLEAAGADSEISDEEMDHIRMALRRIYHIDETEVAEVMMLTREEREKSIDLWQFTNLINQHYDVKQKILLLEHVWRVILSDGALDKFEDYLARQLRPLLRLDHRQWVEAKMQAQKMFRQ